MLGRSNVRASVSRQMRLAAHTTDASLRYCSKSGFRFARRVIWCTVKPDYASHRAQSVDCLATAAVSVAIIYFSIPMSNTVQNNFDVILVLGTPMKADGSISALARSRVLEAVRQYRAQVAPRLLLSGGAAHNRFVEAEVMARFAESQGVPPSAIVIEGQSLNTIQNAYYSYRIMQAHDWQSALIVSNANHLRRASLIFRYYPIAWRTQAAPWPRDASTRPAALALVQRKPFTPATCVSSAFPLRRCICRIPPSPRPGFRASSNNQEQVGRNAR